MAAHALTRQANMTGEIEMNENTQNELLVSGNVPEEAEYIVLTDRDYEAIIEVDDEFQLVGLSLQEAADRALKLTLTQAVEKVRKLIDQKQQFSVWCGIQEIADSISYSGKPIKFYRLDETPEPFETAFKS